MRLCSTTCASTRILSCRDSPEVCGTEGSRNVKPRAPGTTHCTSKRGKASTAARHAHLSEWQWAFGHRWFELGDDPGSLQDSLTWWSSLCRFYFGSVRKLHAAFFGRHSGPRRVHQHIAGMPCLQTTMHSGEKPFTSKLKKIRYIFFCIIRSHTPRLCSNCSGRAAAKKPHQTSISSSQAKGERCSNWPQRLGSQSLRLQSPKPQTLTLNAGCRAVSTGCNHGYVARHWRQVPPCGWRALKLCPGRRRTQLDCCGTHFKDCEDEYGYDDHDYDHDDVGGDVDGRVIGMLMMMEAKERSCNGAHHRERIGIMVLNMTNHQ